MKSWCRAATLIALLCPLVAHRASAETIRLGAEQFFPASRYDELNRTPVIVLQADGIADWIDKCKHIDSVYLILSLGVAVASADMNEISCLKVSGARDWGTLAFDTSYGEVNVAVGDPRQVVIDVTDLVVYWKRDPRLPRQMFVTRCESADQSARIVGLDLDRSYVEFRFTR